MKYLFQCAGIIGLITFLQWFLVWNIPKEIPCIPPDAVNYEGDTNTWEDINGKVLLYSPEEDTYNWCLEVVK